MKTHLIMPMGGRGSRFFENGFVIPKPLIGINGKPFFYWSTKSISDFMDLVDITFVVLQEHVDEFKIDTKIKEFFPNAKIEIIPEVLNGAVLTCLAGIQNINDNYPVIFNDCDHMFSCKSFAKVISSIDSCEFDGALLTFESNEPKYSYAKLNDEGNLICTVEKQVVSNQAICGAYFFSNAKLFKDMSERYLKNCSYNEFYVSGVYNEMVALNKKVKTFLTDFHIPFGTPAEYYEAEKSDKFEVFR